MILQIILLLLRKRLVGLSLMSQVLLMCFSMYWGQTGVRGYASKYALQPREVKSTAAVSTTT